MNKHFQQCPTRATLATSLTGNSLHASLRHRGFGRTHTPAGRSAEKRVKFHFGLVIVVEVYQSSQLYKSEQLSKL